MLPTLKTTSSTARQVLREKSLLPVGATAQDALSPEMQAENYSAHQRKTDAFSKTAAEVVLQNLLPRGLLCLH